MLTCLIRTFRARPLYRGGEIFARAILVGVEAVEGRVYECTVYKTRQGNGSGGVFFSFPSRQHPPIDLISTAWGIVFLFLFGVGDEVPFY